MKEKRKKRQQQQQQQTKTNKDRKEQGGETEAIVKWSEINNFVVHLS